MNYLFAEVPVSPIDPSYSSFINSLARMVEDQIGRTAIHPSISPGFASSPRRLRNLADDHREWVSKELASAQQAREDRRAALIQSAIDSCAYAVGFEAAAKVIEKGTTLRDELAAVAPNAEQLWALCLEMSGHQVDGLITRH